MLHFGTLAASDGRLRDQSFTAYVGLMNTPRVIHATFINSILSHWHLCFITRLVPQRSLGFLHPHTSNTISPVNEARTLLRVSASARTDFVLMNTLFWTSPPCPSVVGRSSFPFAGLADWLWKLRVELPSPLAFT